MRWIFIAFVLITACQEKVNELPKIPQIEDQQSEMLPLYSLYHVLMNTGVKIGRHDSAYSNMQYRAYGIGPSEFEKMIIKLSDFDEGPQVLEAVKTEINFQLNYYEKFLTAPLGDTIRSLKSSLSKQVNTLEDVLELNEKDLQRFYINLFVPYLTIKLDRGHLNSVDEIRILSLVKKVVGIDLSILWLTIADYDRGHYYSVNPLQQVNEALAKHQKFLFIDLDTRLAHLFQIQKLLAHGIPWIDEGISREFQTIVVKRFYPQILPGMWGYSTHGENSVVVIEDAIRNAAIDLVKELQDTTQIKYDDVSYSRMWKRARLHMGISEANQIRRHLLYRDMNFKNLDSLIQELIYSTAMHESKHKLDEGKLFINLDTEISAYLTQIIYSHAPYISLMNTIDWTQEYYQATKEVKLKLMLKELWEIARNVYWIENPIEVSLSSIQRGEEFLRKSILQLYLNFHQIHNGEPFPPLTQVEENREGLGLMIIR